MVAALELDDLVTAGMTSSQADGTHRCLGAGTDHAQLFNRWHQRTDFLREARFQYAGGTKTQTILRSLNDGAYDGRVRMTEYHWPPGANVVDVTTSVFALKPRTPGALDKDWIAADSGKCAYRRINSARNYLLCFREQAHRLPRLIRAQNGRQRTS